MGRVVGPMGGCNGDGGRGVAATLAPAPHTMLQSETSGDSGSAMEVAASSSTAGRMTSISRVPFFTSSDDRRCSATGDVHCNAASSIQSPSLRAIQAGKGCNKKKSPYSVVMFKSPLSRMLLSPRARTSYSPSPRSLMRQKSPCLDVSPRIRLLKRTSPSTEFDLNASPYGARYYFDLNAEPEELNAESMQEGAEPEQLNAGMQHVNTEEMQGRAEPEQLNARLQQMNGELMQSNVEPEQVTAEVQGNEVLITF